MQSFISSLKERYPNKKHVFLFAVKRQKKFDEMLEFILPVCERIILTNFFAHHPQLKDLSEEPEEVAKFLKKRKFEDFIVQKDSEAALGRALSSERERKLVVTGSLYLIGEVYKIISKN